jgi:hypothetical protein
VMRPMFSWRVEGKVLEATQKGMLWSQVNKSRINLVLKARLTSTVFLRVLEYYKGEI